MSGSSPVAAYLDACNAYHEIHEFDSESPSFLQKLREQQAVLQSCVRELLAVAETQDPEIWRAIGMAYNNGLGAARNADEAIRWYQRAAEAGNSAAMVSLGLRLQRPQPGRDPAGAVRWFQKAASLGNPGGMTFLGFAYREATDVPRDYDLAVAWFIKAVEAGDPHAMIHVGRMYAHYLKRPTEAVPWFLRAAQAGQSESYVELANLYHDRETVVYDPVEAHKWYRVVAEHSEGNSARALLAIARQYSQGVGVPCDVEMARVWLRRLLSAVPATSLAHREATEMLKELVDRFL
jgi:TPR repeat protein